MTPFIFAIIVAILYIVYVGSGKMRDKYLSHLKHDLESVGCEHISKELMQQILLSVRGLKDSNDIILQSIRCYCAKVFDNQNVSDRMEDILLAEAKRKGLFDRPL